MKLRTLGRTGVQVSRFGLGTMVLGAWGNTDHDDCITLINRAIDAGINLIDTADVYAFGESEEIVGKALVGASRRGGAGDQVPQRHDRRPEPPRELAPLDPHGGGGQPAPSPDRPHRPLPDSPSRPDDRHRRDDRRTHRPRPRRQDRCMGHLDVPCVRPRRGVLGGRSPFGRGTAFGAAAVLDHVPGHRDRGAAHLPASRHRCHRVEPVVGRVVDRQVPAVVAGAGRIARRHEP